MSEESKIDSDYVHLFDAPSNNGNSNNVASTVTNAVPPDLDDPKYTPEERDLRLAIALQQQENNAALHAIQKKQAETSRSKALRSGRSGAMTGLAAIRAREKRTPFVPATVSSDYVPPSTTGFAANTTAGPHAMTQEDKDYALAVELQKVEASSAGSAKLAQVLQQQESNEKSAKEHRVMRSKNMRGFA